MHQHLQPPPDCVRGKVLPLVPPKAVGRGAPWGPGKWPEEQTTSAARRDRELCVRAATEMSASGAGSLDYSTFCLHEMIPPPFTRGKLDGHFSRKVGLTTKICTRGRSTRDHSQGFVTNPHACLLAGASFLPWRRGIGSTLERHPFSGLVHSAGELLHTP